MKCVREGYIKGYSGEAAIKIVRVDECQKDYTCKECESDIKLGSPYFSFTHRLDYHKFYSDKICIKCGKELYGTNIWPNKRV